MLYTLVYLSVSNTAQSNETLLDILTSAREKNKRLGITGMLLYMDGYFIQNLEGEESAVKTVFASIAQDTRHHDVKTIYENKLEARVFPNWTMGFNQVTVADLAPIKAYKTLNDVYIQLTNKPNYAVELLETFLYRSEF